ncbi:hypothetical protein VP01_4503g1 [Puccinia sorghi]|uniref:Uncharacterized protein n=1 Tax=Puccinia sorghi TaxID=27349 RepID=A0A0L6UP22_9BASI|nr:hypothetical protein VP01_4503g1 [Puccinia sorghi]
MNKEGMYQLSFQKTQILVLPRLLSETLTDLFPPITIFSPSYTPLLLCQKRVALNADGCDLRGLKLIEVVVIILTMNQVAFLFFFSCPLLLLFLLFPIRNATSLGPEPIIVMHSPLESLSPVVPGPEHTLSLISQLTISFSTGLRPLFLKLLLFTGMDFSEFGNRCKIQPKIEIPLPNLANPVDPFHHFSVIIIFHQSSLNCLTFFLLQLSFILFECNFFPGMMTLMINDNPETNQLFDPSECIPVALIIPVDELVSVLSAAQSSVCSEAKFSMKKTKATCTHCIARYKGVRLYLERQCVHIVFTLGLVTIIHQAKNKGNIRRCFKLMLQNQFQGNFPAMPTVNVAKINITMNATQIWKRKKNCYPNSYWPHSKVYWTHFLSIKVFWLKRMEDGSDFEHWAGSTGGKRRKEPIVIVACNYLGLNRINTRCSSCEGMESERLSHESRMIT